MANAVTPTVFVNAGNDTPPGANRPTGVSIEGANFLPGTAVNIKLSPGSLRGTAMVRPDGSFDWDATIRPALGCGVTVIATVHGYYGIEVSGEGQVFCP